MLKKIIFVVFVLLAVPACSSLVDSLDTQATQKQMSK